MVKEFLGLLFYNLQKWTVTFLSKIWRKLVIGLHLIFYNYLFIVIKIEDFQIIYLVWNQFLDKEGIHWVRQTKDSKEIPGKTNGMTAGDKVHFF